MINKPKGTHDILQSETGKWQYIEDVFAETARVFGFSEIRTPMFEATELFARSAGSGSDIVNKEMYTFIDKGGRSMTLKPEGTAGVARSFIENGMANLSMPVKLWYNTPVFRYEKPQAGRFRQHHQIGCELFGSNLPEADYEVIALADAFFKRLNIADLRLCINSIGCSECRAGYLNALKDYFSKLSASLCGQCNFRLENNTLRILDCKEAGCGSLVKNAPIITDYLCDGCASHFGRLQTLLTNAGIEFVVDPFIVRGLDYYSGTVFEFVTDSIGAKSTVCGGGRYDGLIYELGGRATAAAGFGIGIERLILLLEQHNKIRAAEQDIDVYFAVMNDNARAKAYEFIPALRREFISAETDLTGRQLKAQMKYADSVDAVFAVIIGEEELAGGYAQIKNMFTESQERVRFDELVKYLIKQLS